MKKNRRMFWQVYPCFLMIVLLSMIGVTVYASRAMRAYFLIEIEADLNVRARLLERQFSDYLLSRDVAAVDHACKDIGGESDTRITVITPKGIVIGDSHELIDRMDNHGDRPEFKAALLKTTGSAVRYSKTLKQNMMYIAIPLVHDAEVIGALRSSVSISTIDEKLDDIKRRIAVGGMFVALLAAGVSLFISWRITRPVQELKKGAEKFSQGDLTYRLAVPESEEMAQLAVTMNDMASHLDDRIKAVIRQKNELEAVLSSMSEGVLAVDKEERIITHNPAFSTIFDLADSDLSGRSLQEIIRSAELQKYMQRSLCSEFRDKADITVYTPEERILRVYSTPLADAGGKQAGTLFVINDVTKVKFLETMRRDFAINVSHEIKTPLTAIKGFVETLRDAPALDAQEAKKFLGIIEKHVNRLVGIVEDLKHLTEIEDAGENKAMDFDQLEIAKVLEAAVQACQEKAEEKQIRLAWSCDAGLHARINPPLLERALVNLIDNAVTYSEAGGSIHVSARSDSSGALISVKDSGIGISAKHHQRIFERFYRVDKDRSRSSGGTGLGLAIVKHIVRAHGGRVHVESQPEKGSTFEILLPAAL